MVCVIVICCELLFKGWLFGLIVVLDTCYWFVLFVSFLVWVVAVVLLCGGVLGWWFLLLVLWTGVRLGVLGVVLFVGFVVCADCRSVVFSC